MASSMISRQPKGIPVGGQFAATEHGEAGVALRPAGPAPLTEEAVLAAVASHNGPGAMPGVRRRIAETTTEGGRQLFLQRCDAMYNRDSGYRVDRSLYGPTPEQCDALAALGYESVNQFSRQKLDRFRGVDSLIDGKVGPERLEVLDRLSTHEHQWSAWEKAAYLNAPLDDLEQVIADKYMTRADKYVATVTLMGLDDHSARAREAIGMKIGDRALIEADTHALEDLADLRDALPESKRNAAHLIGLADRGITGMHLRSYGSKACEKYTAKELDEALITPKTIRSYLTAGFHPSLGDMTALHDAGYTSGNDLKAASKVLGTTDIKLLTAARRHATGAQLEAFSRATGNKLRTDDPQAVGRLLKLGIDHPDQLRPWAAACHRRANSFINRDQSILSVHADIIKAGITPERLGAMTRAGIPVTEAVKHQNTDNPWAAGAAYRAAWDADQANKVARGWESQPAPWAYTEDTYLEGADQ